VPPGARRVDRKKDRPRARESLHPPQHLDSTLSFHALDGAESKCCQRVGPRLGSGLMARHLTLTRCSRASHVSFLSFLGESPGSYLSMDSPVVICLSFHSLLAPASPGTGQECILCPLPARNAFSYSFISYSFNSVPGSGQWES
jgi:hypothetical protein